MGLRASLAGQRKTETVKERREKTSFFPPPQLSIQWERKFDMADLNTFSIISKQKVSPAAVFRRGRGVFLPAL